MRIIFTSDVHGHAEKLLQCAASFAKDKNTLIIDGGDTIQGSPLASYIHTHVSSAPIAETLNLAGFDFVTLGNHDFNFGPDYLRAYLYGLNATCVCANVTGDLPLVPWVIHTMPDGTKIGITGIVTDYVNVWEKPENLQGITISPPFEAAQHALQQMKNQVDLSICIYHGGFECDITTDEVLTHSTENIGSKICRELDFDILLTGHQHMPLEGAVLHGTYIVQPGAYAQHFVEITWEGLGQISSKFVAADTKPPQNAHHLTAIKADVDAWLDTPIGTLPQPLLPDDPAQMALHGNSIATLYNHVQLQATGAQISCVGLPNNIPGFKQCVTMRDIVQNYPFSNNLITLEITVDKLKMALERTASYLSISENGVPQVSRAFLYPKVEHYNYDFFQGLTYTADLTKPIGQRVSDIIIGGAPADNNKTYTICMSNYRATGTGGYEVYTTCPILEYGHQEVSELICSYISQTGDIYVENKEVPNWTYT